MLARFSFRLLSCFVLLNALAVASHGEELKGEDAKSHVVGGTTVNAKLTFKPDGESTHFDIKLNVKRKGADTTGFGTATLLLLQEDGSMLRLNTVSLVARVGQTRTESEENAGTEVKAITKKVFGYALIVQDGLRSSDPAATEDWLEKEGKVIAKNMAELKPGDSVEFGQTLVRRVK